MAKKKENEAEQEGAKPAPAADGEAKQADGDDSAAPGGKKRKLVLILGIAGVGLAAAGVGGFFVMKTLSSGSKDMAAKTPEGQPTGAAAATHADGKDSDPKATGTKTEAAGATKDGEKDKAKTEDSKTAKDGQADANADKQGQGEGKSSNGSHDGNEKKPGQFGDTIDIPKMELNLGNPLENRFLRFGLSLEYHGGEEQEKNLNRRMPQIRDLVISLISRKTRVELLSADGKEAFRKQLKNTLNELLDEPVTNIYFTEFLVE